MIRVETALNQAVVWCSGAVTESLKTLKLEQRYLYLTTGLLNITIYNNKCWSFGDL